MAPTRASTSTSRSIFSDNETAVQKYRGENDTDVGTVVDPDRPLIDLDDQDYNAHGQGDKLRLSASAPHQVEAVALPGQTPGEKLRMLLRQMEAEVRSTTAVNPAPATVPAPAMTMGEYHRRSTSGSSAGSAQVELVPVTTSIPARSNWRQGRRKGALPMERKYTPPSSPEQQPDHLREQQREEEEEQMEVLEDSPPTPPLRITNPYLYASRRTSDEREYRDPRPNLPRDVMVSR